MIIMSTLLEVLRHIFPHRGWTCLLSAVKRAAHCIISCLFDKAVFYSGEEKRREERREEGGEGREERGEEREERRRQI